VCIDDVVDIRNIYELFFFVNLEDITSDTWEDNIRIIRNGMARLWIRFACIGLG